MPVDFPSAAAIALKQGHFREAIEVHKAWAKSVPTADWKPGLAEAYAGRAAELEAKGMFKEAIALWRNRSEVCGTQLFDGRYPHWLLRVGEAAEACRAFEQRWRNAGEDAAARATIEAQLAPVFLSMTADEVAHFPADSGLIRFRAPALAALQAYADGVDDIDVFLKEIPFRSPYRDFGLILKALMQSATDPVAASSLLERIAPDSGFQPIAAAIRAASRPFGAEAIGLMQSLSPEQRALASALLGVSQRLVPVVDDLLRQFETLQSETAVFQFALNHRHALPAGSARSICLSFLPRYESLQRDFERAFGRLNPIEASRIRALRAEWGRDYEIAVSAWRKTMDQLPASAADHSLRSAMILRHLADLSEIALGRSGPPSKYAVEWLEQSLKLDPADLPTLLRLLRLYRRMGRMTEWRALFEQAETLHKEQVEILFEAVEAALASNAFKKAQSYARKILAIDPINTRIRSLLVDAHLAHARKHIKGNKLDAAEKELNEAVEWLRSPRERGAHTLLRAFVPQGRGEKPAAAALVGQASEMLGNDLATCFVLGLEAARLGRKPASELAAFGLKIPAKAEASEIAVLLKCLETSGATEAHLRAALAPLSAAFHVAAAVNLPVADVVAICETLLRFDQLDTVAVFAKAARKRHPREPAIVYHAVNAKFSRSPYLIPDREYDALSRAFDDAKKQNDERTALRIELLLFPPEQTLDRLPYDANEQFGDVAGGLPMGIRFLDTPEDAAAILDMISALRPKQFIEAFKSLLGKEAVSDMERTFGRAGLINMLVELLTPIANNTAPPAAPLRPPMPEPAPKPQPAPKGRPSDPRQRDLFDD